MEVPRRQTGAHRLLCIVVRPLQGACPGSGRAGCRVRRQHLHLQGEYRRGAGTRRRVRHPLDPDAAFHPHQRQAPDRTGCPAQGVAQGGHRQGTAQQVDRHGTHRRQSPLPAEPPVPAADGLPRRGDHTIGIRTSGHRPGEVYRMRQMRRALRQTGHTQTGRQWKNCVGSASCNGLSTGSKRHSNAHTGSA